MIGNETHSHLTKYNRSEGPRGKRERAEMDDRGCHRTARRFRTEVGDTG